jgi:hypothetical protein
LLVVLAVLATVLSMTVLSTAPASSAAAPTLSPVPATSLVGRTLTLRGTAPPQSTVVVQRRYAGGALARIGTARASRSGAWSLRTRLARPGATTFRAVAGGRASSARTVTAHQWLDLVDQPFDIVTSFGRYDVTSLIGGTSLPRSIEVNELGYLAIKTAGLCTQVRFSSGVLDSDRPGRDGDEVANGEIERFDSGGYVGGGSVPFEATAADGAVRFTTPLAAGGRIANVVTVRFLADDPDDGLTLRAGLGTPQVLCSTARLPELPREEFPD